MMWNRLRNKGDNGHDRGALGGDGPRTSGRRSAAQLGAAANQLLDPATRSRCRGHHRDAEFCGERLRVDDNAFPPGFIHEIQAHDDAV